MLLAKGDPTWWGSVQAWFIMNEDLLVLLGAMLALLWILKGRKR